MVKGGKLRIEWPPPGTPADTVEAVRAEIAEEACEVRRVTAAVNDQLLRPPSDAGLVQYLVREPLDYRTSHRAGPAPSSTHGFAERLVLRPAGWDAVVSADGLPPLRVPASREVTIELEPESEALQMVHLELGGGLR